MTALFGNLLDNALEAVLLAQKASVPTTDSKELFIELNVEHRDNSAFTIVTLVNSCMTKPVSTASGRLRSGKGDKQHGLGMSSVERVVHAYDGKMEIFYNEEKKYVSHHYHAEKTKNDQKMSFRAIAVVNDTQGL